MRGGYSLVVKTPARSLRVTHRLLLARFDSFLGYNGDQENYFSHVPFGMDSVTGWNTSEWCVVANDPLSRGDPAILVSRNRGIERSELEWCCGTHPEALSLPTAPPGLLARGIPSSLFFYNARVCNTVTPIAESPQ